MSYEIIDLIWAEWLRQPRSQEEDDILHIRLSTGVNRDQAKAMLYETV